MSVKIVNVMGGLGNQMFQYAFAIALQNEYPDSTVKLNTSCFRGYKLHNGYELKKIFNIQFPYATILDLMRYAYPWINYHLWQFKRYLPKRKCMAADRDFRPDCDIILAKEKSYFDGYWQTPKYFEKYRQEIIQAFKMPDIKDSKNLRAVEYIRESKTGFIHIRRGDYINHPILGNICTDKYYANAINIIRDKYGFSRFIILSNDISWCKENLAKYLEDCDILYIDWNNGDQSFRDIQLMSLCNAGIIANSTFSWWGAWLSSADVIFCPPRWINVKGIHDEILSPSWYDEIVPSSWIKVANE